MGAGRQKPAPLPHFCMLGMSFCLVLLQMLFVFISERHFHGHSTCLFRALLSSPPWSEQLICGESVDVQQRRFVHDVRIANFETSSRLVNKGGNG